MSIVIKMRDNKWIIQLKDEQWLFEDKQYFEKNLRDLIELKEKYGKIKREDY